MSPLDFLARGGRKPPLAGAFFAPADLTDLALIQALAILARDLVAAHSAGAHAQFQRRNGRSLINKVKILLALVEALKDSSFGWSPPSSARLPYTATVCLRELYIWVYRARILLDYCSKSGKLWLLIRNRQISGNFHDLNQELATLLDVLPLDEFRLSSEVREQVELLRRQSLRSRIYMDPKDEELRRKVVSFLEKFGQGGLPSSEELRSTFVDRLGIGDAKTCRAEIDFLEEQICNPKEEGDPALLGGVVALARYCRFLLFGFQDVDFDRKIGGSNGDQAKQLKKLGSGEGSFSVPKDFCCPISLDLMRDPVTVSTGQTYDRASITQWMDEGHRTCPNSGQILTHNRLVPNRALRSLISQWCAANGIPFDTPEITDGSNESMAAACAGRAAIEANRATARILVRQLAEGSEDARTVAARELRLLAKTGKDNRVYIAEAGAVPLLCRLLRSPRAVTQENAVTALLNLSIYEGNKGRLIEEEGCLTLVVHVLTHGATVEARENAAATLFSLSAVHEFKKLVIDEPGAVEALASMLARGSPRGKKDAVMAMFNLSTHAESWVRMMDSGAVSALVGAVGNESVAEEAAGALALLMKQPIVAEAVGGEGAAVADLVGLMRRGAPKGKENAVSALYEMCRVGGSALTQKVARTPGLGGLIQTILFSGTKRARRKAASLAKICHRTGSQAPSMAVGNAGMDVDHHALARSSSLRRPANFGSGDVSVSVMAIQVPVL